MSFDHSLILWRINKVLGSLPSRFSRCTYLSRSLLGTITRCKSWMHGCHLLSPHKGPSNLTHLSFRRNDAVLRVELVASVAVNNLIKMELDSQSIVRSIEDLFISKEQQICELC